MSAVWLGRCTCLLVLLLTLGACENGMQEMYRQPKLTPLAPTPLWPDGRAARPLEADTVVHSAGTLAASSSGRGELVSEEEDDSQATYTHAALERGRQRFDIYCAPCHGLSGDGNGYITARGFPHPPSYHSDRLRAAPDSHFFEVITLGYGDMYSYADRVTPADRRAIIAYIRALQLSRHASLSALPASDRARLGAAP
ncbi:MAG: c-type cytochrome [Steroidobacteraceae bacterium]